MFENGDHRKCHNVEILDNNLCELNETKHFFSNLQYENGEMPITIRPQRTHVTILEEMSDCSKSCHTVIPLIILVYNDSNICYYCETSYVIPY